MYCKKTLAIGIILLICGQQILAQKIDSLLYIAENAKLSNYQLKIETNILSNSISLEKRITNNSSIYSQISYNFSSFRSGGITYMIYETSPVYLFTPKTHIGYRYYHNLGKRVLEEKKIQNNSGNYFAINSELYTSFLNLSNVKEKNLGYHAISLVPGYGIQRTYGKRSTIDFWAGAGPMVSDDLSFSLSIRLDLRIGFIVLKSQ